MTSTISDLRPRQPVVLYVENNPDDVVLLEMVMRRCHTAFALESVRSVEEAKRFLSAKDAGHGLKPDLILLDYTLGHHQTGLQVLQWLNAHPHTASIPVVIFCGDELPSVVKNSYREGAHCFLCKPSTFDGSIQIVQHLDRCLSTTPPCLEPLLRLNTYRAPIRGADAGTLKTGRNPATT